MARQFVHLGATAMRVTRLDDQGNPTGASHVLPISAFTMTTNTKEHPMTKLDPSDPSTLSDDEAAALCTRPTKALVIDLLQRLRAERDRTDAIHRAHTDAMMDLRTSEDDRKAIRAQLDADPEARLVADMEAAITAYGDRVEEARRTATRVRDTVYAEADTRYGYQRQQPQPYQPALDSAIGRALLHVAQRHGVKVEATMVFPEPQGPTLAVVPPHLAGALEQLANQGGF